MEAAGSALALRQATESFITTSKYLGLCDTLCFYRLRGRIDLSRRVLRFFRLLDKLRRSGPDKSSAAGGDGTPLSSTRDLAREAQTLRDIGRQLHCPLWR